MIAPAKCTLYSFTPGRGLDEVVERHRHRLAVEVGERGAEQEVVPDVGELPDDADHRDRPRGRQHDPPEDGEEPRAVDHRRPDQLGRELLVVVLEVERREADAVDEVDEDQPRHGAGDPHQARAAAPSGSAPSGTG